MFSKNHSCLRYIITYPSCENSLLIMSPTLSVRVMQNFLDPTFQCYWAKVSEQHEYLPSPRLRSVMTPISQMVRPSKADIYHHVLRVSTRESVFIASATICMLGSRCSDIQLQMWTSRQLDVPAQPPITSYQLTPMSRDFTLPASLPPNFVSYDIKVYARYPSIRMRFDGCRIRREINSG